MAPKKRPDDSPAPAQDSPGLDSPSPDSPSPDSPSPDSPGLGDFEASVAELEGLVESLEAGDVSLEEALARFERGVTLSRQCQTLLKGAELRVDQLLSEGDEDRVAPFDTASDSAAT